MANADLTDATMHVISGPVPHPEEEMEPDSGNATGIRALAWRTLRDRICQPLSPRPGDGVHIAARSFRRGARALRSLQQGEILLLAGFEWDWTTAGARLEVAELSVYQLDSALRHSEFPEWMGAIDRPVFVGTEVLDAIGARTRAEQPAPVRPQPPRARPRLEPVPVPTPPPGGKPKQ